MKIQALSLASIIVGGLSFGAAGCILGSNPNENSMLYAGGTAGTTGSAGANGTAGAAGSSGPNGAVPGNPLALFNTTTDGFVLNSYMELPSSGQHDLGDGTAATPPTVSFDDTVGNPDPGSLKVTAPYTGANQYVDVQNTGMFGTAHPVNWMGGTLRMRIKCDEGTFSGVAEPYAITTSGYPSSRSIGAPSWVGEYLAAFLDAVGVTAVLLRAAPVHRKVL